MTIRHPTFVNAGIVCKNELKMILRLFNFLSILKTLATLKILKTEKVVLTSLINMPIIPKITTKKSNKFHPDMKYQCLLTIILRRHSNINT